VQTLSTESLADAKVSARRHYVYERLVKKSTANQRHANRQEFSDRS